MKMSRFCLRIRYSYLALAAAAAALVASPTGTDAATILGTGTGALLGSDLTDPENDGTPDGSNYNATFAASEEPGFGGGEFAFNVFNNQVGGGNAKWCCGGASPGTFPIWVEATFEQPVVLTSFTLTSGNDTPGRDPVDWEILGTNDGATFSQIHVQSGSLWTARDQVILWEGAGADFATPAAYSTIRLNVIATGLTTGALFQLSEIEIFGNVIPEPSAIAFFGLAGLGLILRRRR